MLFEEGLLERENGHWSLAGDLGQLTPRLHPGASRRLDRLPEQERRLLERGAVEGEVFHRDAVAVLQGSPIWPPLPAASSSWPARSTVAGADAYRPLPDPRRGVFGDPEGGARGSAPPLRGWLEEMSGERLVEQEEILGYHLEQACRYHAELGRRSDEDTSRPPRAARWLASAGDRAAKRGDMRRPEAPRARSEAAAGGRRAPAGDRARPRLGPHPAGRVRGSRGALRPRGRARRRGRQAGRARARIERMDVVNIIRPDGAGGDVQARDGGRAELSAGRRPRARARLADACVRPEHARPLRRDVRGPGARPRPRRPGGRRRHPLGDPRLAADALARGPVPTGRALERCRELLASGGRPPAEAGALAGIALIEAMVGRFDEARRPPSAAAGSRRSSASHTLAVGDIWLGELELYAGDHPAAEQAFGAAATFLEERGDRNFYPTAAAGLARARFHQQRYGEADEALRSAEATTASDDFITVVWTLGTRARLLVREGKADEAAASAERGVALASETDDLNLQAESLIELLTSCKTRNGRLTRSSKHWA